ncbi:sulfide/dihydroorotate dehydrogenase-like FAD/NAD-binding protein [candidate division FCPU426 bacterium]|nr:sulfide/dihydroorotate dehydrogenase-like FAD/NAD-binding protein [candidate division FCPU426 bacterium]
MYPIISKQLLAPQVWRYTVKAPEIARERQAGNFIILRPREGSERIPLTIVSSDTNTGTIDIIFQVVGATTLDLAEADNILDVVGPLGHPTHIENFGRVAVVGGGVGIAPLLPIAEALKKAGNSLTTILGARSKNFLILEEELALISDRMIITTDDGSKGEKGLVTAALKPLLDAQALDFVLAIGPVVMMKAVAGLTRPYQVKTMVSLNPLMIDGTGMCGVCRCKVDGKTQFACVDGPEFDGHKVDFDSLQRRLAMYQAEEKIRRDRRN